MTTLKTDPREKLARAVPAYNFAAIDGWERLERLAERVDLVEVETDLSPDAHSKWFARHRVHFKLLNWDDEEFGNIHLYLAASGSTLAHHLRIDCLLLSPHEH